MLSVTLLLLLAAFGCTVLSAIGKLPIWIAVLFILLIELLRVMPR